VTQSDGCINLFQCRAVCFAVSSEHVGALAAGFRKPMLGCLGARCGSKSGVHVKAQLQQRANGCCCRVPAAGPGHCLERWERERLHALSPGMAVAPLKRLRPCARKAASYLSLVHRLKLISPLASIREQSAAAVGDVCYCTSLIDHDAGSNISAPHHQHPLARAQGRVCQPLPPSRGLPGVPARQRGQQVR